MNKLIGGRVTWCYRKGLSEVTLNLKPRSLLLWRGKCWKNLITSTVHVHVSRFSSSFLKEIVWNIHQVAICVKFLRNSSPILPILYEKPLNFSILIYHHPLKNIRAPLKSNVWNKKVKCTPKLHSQKKVDTSCAPSYIVISILINDDVGYPSVSLLIFPIFCLNLWIIFPAV
jgi:hypothetical protein